MLLKPRDLLFSRSGTLGRAYVHQAGEEPATFAGYLIRFTPSNTTDHRYLKYCSQSALFAGQIASDAIVSTIANFNAERYGQVHLPWWPEAEQRRIASFLDAETARIDALVAKKRRTRELLTERVQATIGTEFDKLLRRVPLVRLGAVANVRSGMTLDSGRPVDGVAISRPYLRVANVQDGHVDLTEVKSVRVPLALAHRFELRVGDVLLTEGGDPDKLGRGAIWRGEVPGCLHQNHIFAVRPTQALLPEYLALVSRTQYARVYFETTASKTTGIASTSSSKIASFRVPLPAPEEQRRVVMDVNSKLTQIDRLAKLIDRQVLLILEHRQALITAAMTGELEVPSRVGGDAAGSG